MEVVWFNLILCDINTAMVEAWQRHWEPSPVVPVRYHTLPFQEVPEEFDCIVSPANSFGLMDGGIDAHISNYFGGQSVFIPRVQKAILEEWGGQQPVGTSFIIATGRETGCRFLAHTPTMRLPEKVAGTDIAYRSMWSMLLAVRNHNRHNPTQKITSVLCSGLGTGVGRMSFEEAAKQMALAYKHFVTNPADTKTDCSQGAHPGYLISWSFARDIQDEVTETVNLTARSGGKPSSRGLGMCTIG